MVNICKCNSANNNPIRIGTYRITGYFKMDFLFNISTYDQIKSLWTNAQRETIKLEFKSEISSTNDEIAKDISSFANAEGGIIIYGIKEDTGRAVYSEGILIQKGRINSDRIQHIVSSSISPPLEVRILSIDVLDEDGNPILNKEFIIIRIPKSNLD